VGNPGRATSGKPATESAFCRSGSVRASPAANRSGRVLANGRPIGRAHRAHGPPGPLRGVARVQGARPGAPGPMPGSMARGVEPRGLGSGRLRLSVGWTGGLSRGRPGGQVCAASRSASSRLNFYRRRRRVPYSKTTAALRANPSPDTPPSLPCLDSSRPLRANRAISRAPASWAGRPGGLARAYAWIGCRVCRVGIRDISSQLAQTPRRRGNPPRGEYSSMDIPGPAVRHGTLTDGHISGRRCQLTKTRCQLTMGANAVV
jgi:hypothetical protein